MIDANLLVAIAIPCTLAVVGAFIAVWRKLGDVSTSVGELKGKTEDYSGVKEKIDKVVDGQTKLNTMMDDHIRRYEREIKVINKRIEALEGRGSHAS